MELSAIDAPRAQQPASAGYAAVITPVSQATSPGVVPRKRLLIGRWVLAAASFAFCLKLALAFNTLGSNDAVTFYAFARSLSDHGLKWTYERGVAWLPNGPIFNHPPMTAWFLQGIRALSQNDLFRANGLSFPFLLRLPGIISDFVVVVVAMTILRHRSSAASSRWALAMLALSPVSLMVSGFHGNTDSVMVMFLFLAAASCVRGTPVLSGLFFALGCQVKIIPLLFLPVFLFFWMHRRVLPRFIAPCLAASLVMWWEPLTRFPALFVKNVLSYGSYWGLWGITYWLRATGAQIFSSSWLNFSWTQTLVATLLKLVIVGGVTTIAWRRRLLDGVGPIESIALGWLLFFVFSPGVCAQYLVWPAPFLLVLSPGLFAIITATSALFLFFFYNAICHGLPWYVGVSTNQLVGEWAPWTVWPWAAFIIATALAWKSMFQPGSAPTSETGATG